MYICIAIQPRTWPSRSLSARGEGCLAAVIPNSLFCHPLPISYSDEALYRSLSSIGLQAVCQNTYIYICKSLSVCVYVCRLCSSIHVDNIYPVFIYSKNSIFFLFIIYFVALRWLIYLICETLFTGFI